MLPMASPIICLPLPLFDEKLGFGLTLTIVSNPLFSVLP
jgi:hypothetical protein